MTDTKRGFGRLVVHDPRDFDYLIPPRRLEAAVVNSRFWPSPGTLDQGATPHCVAYGGNKYLTAAPVINAPIDPLTLYNECQRNDDIEGEDYAGTTVRGLFKSLQARGLVTQYQWAFDWLTIVNHVLLVGPVVMGTCWPEGMEPDANSYLNPVNELTFDGHAWLIVGADKLKKNPDGTQGAVQMVNSWGETWGQKGRAWLSFDDLDVLIKLQGEAAVATEVIPRPPAQVRLDENRVKLFGKIFGDWEVWYNGVDSPADNCPSWAIWDNPVDDDGIAVYEAGGGFRFNTPTRGQLTINRSAPPLTRPWGSVISRRDETLRSGDGFTMNWRVAIHPPTQLGDFMAYYRRLDGLVLGVFLGPGVVAAGGYNQHRLGFSANAQVVHDTSKPTTYWVDHRPRTASFDVYINDKLAIKGAKGNKARITSVHEFEKNPYIILGGEKGNNRSHFTLSHFAPRYRRGGFAPGEEKGVPVFRRTPPPLPRPRSAGVVEQWHDFTGETPLFRFPKTTRRWTYPDEWRALKPSGRRTVIAGPLEGLVDKGNVTLELDAQVDPITPVRGFGLCFRDRLGTIGLLLSPNRVELAIGIKHIGWHQIPLGIRGVPLDTTVRRTYRLVRQRNSFHWHLYVDDHSIPLIYDHHCDASTGGLPPAGPPALQYGDTGNNWSGGHVTIANLRWCNTAFAPGPI